ncbi:MAG: hypothetical protein Q8Q26_02600 [Pseudorhodobacter sp.]|nr:hypothetical protein [Pseudorhodobacter sp.]
MKPNFALNLTSENIALLHRTARGWLEIGVAALDAPDLGEALSYLRRSALGLAPHGVTTKLVIPNAQILYLELDAPGPDAARRRAQIKRGLEGRTPYAVDDLVFDWRGTGSTVQVAVIAHETLAEAEKFAAEYRFNPISFVAIPDPGKFAGEPWFGPSALAASLLAEGEKVERDQDPITVVSREPERTAPAADAVVVGAAKPEPEPAPTPATTDTLAGSASAGEKKPDAKPAAVGKVPPAAAPAPAPAPSGDPLVLGAGAAAATLAGAAAAPAAAKPTTAAPPPAPPPPAPHNEAAAPKPVPPVPVAAATIPPPTPAAPAPAAPSASTPARPPVVAAADTPAPVAPGFSSRRANEGTAPPFGAARAVDQPAPRPSVAAAPDAPPPPRARFDALTPQPRPPVAAQPRTAPAAAPTPPDHPPAAAHGTMPAALAALRAKRAEGQPVALVTAPGIPGFRSRKSKPVAALPRNAKSAASQPSGKDMFPTRHGTQRGKPRYLGLILTAVLLLFLAIVAAWSTFYIASTGAPESGPVVASDPTAVTAADPAAGVAANATSVADEMLADQQDAGAPAAEHATTTPDPSAVSEPVAALPAAPATAPDPSAPGTEGAAAGPSPLAAAQSGTILDPASDRQDEIFLASTDTPPPALDALALPQTDTADPLPSAQMPPPPFGTTYQFDAAGLIVPTPEGIITPEGVRVVAGRPPVVPPPRPAALDAATPPEIAADVTATAPPGAIATTAPDLVTPTLSDPTLAAARPRDRPEGLVPTAPPDAQAGADDGASLAIPAGSRLTSLRPHPRPTSVLALGEAARRATAAASLSASAAIPAEPQAENGSPLVLAGIGISRRPAARPSDFSNAVQDAVAAAVRPSAQQDATPVTPETEGEPDLASAAPTIPTKASVAKQATFVNAISLSQINLIGVYGTDSDRSALVRMANGNYKKVQVGSKIDGGVVAAITATEVRYQKGGRMITLALPRT